MKASENFYSSQYCEIDWKDIFYNAGISVLDDSVPLGIVNNNGLIMTTESILNLGRIKLCCSNGITEANADDLLSIHSQFLRQAGIFYFMLNNRERNFFLPSSVYLDLIFKVVSLSFEACKKIFLYTHEHLSNRDYDGEPLIKIESIQMQLSVIIMLFENIAVLLNRNCDFIQCMHLIDQMIECLTTLSKLGGARAILKNNAVELMFHLKIFQKYLLG